jgi:hypothetical protein
MEGNYNSKRSHKTGETTTRTYPGRQLVLQDVHHDQRAGLHEVREPLGLPDGAEHALRGHEPDACVLELHAVVLLREHQRGRDRLTSMLRHSFHSHVTIRRCIPYRSAATSRCCSIATLSTSPGSAPVTAKWRSASKMSGSMPSILMCRVEVSYIGPKSSASNTGDPAASTRLLGSMPSILTKT